MDQSVNIFQKIRLIFVFNVGTISYWQICTYLMLVSVKNYYFNKKKFANERCTRTVWWNSWKKLQKYMSFIWGRATNKWGLFDGFIYFAILEDSALWNAWTTHALMSLGFDFKFFLEYFVKFDYRFCLYFSVCKSLWVCS